MQPRGNEANLGSRFLPYKVCGSFATDLILRHADTPAFSNKTKGEVVRLDFGYLLGLIFLGFSHFAQPENSALSSGKQCAFQV